MSVINKTPFIRKVLKKLTVQQINQLIDLVDGKNETASVFRSLIRLSPHELSDNDMGISNVNLEISETGAQRKYQGYLIYPDSSTCVLLAYFSDYTQPLLLIDIKKVDGIWKYQLKGRQLTITELRSELNDIASEKGSGVIIQVDDIDSNGEPQGKAIVSDGEGGAEWSYHAIKQTITGAISGIATEKGEEFNEFLASLQPGDKIFSEADNTIYEVGVAASGDIEFKAYGPDSVTTAIYEYASATESYSYLRTDVSYAADIAAPRYDATSTYAVGDIVAYGNAIYACNTAVSTPEEFDPTKWTEGTVASLILGMINAGY